MIVVRIELWSATTGKRSELARMAISNDGAGTNTVCDYDGRVFIGRSAVALSQERVLKTGRVTGFRRLDLHVWNLVARMLAGMGYH